jgi:hypothetical protein
LRERESVFLPYQGRKSYLLLEGIYYNKKLNKLFYALVDSKIDELSGLCGQEIIDSLAN